MIFIFLWFLTFASAAEKTGFPAALELLQEAQTEYIAGNFSRMHSLLIKAVQAHPNDILITQQAAAFAQIYYAQNPQNIFSMEADLEITLGIRRRFKNNEPLTFLFTLSTFSIPQDAVQHAHITTPHGDSIPILGKNTESRSYPSTTKGKVITHAESKKVLAPLPLGVYTISLSLDKDRHREFSVILLPDSNETTAPQINISTKKSLSWKIPPSSSYHAGAQRFLNFYVYGASSARPIWDKSAQIKSTLTESGRLEFTPPPESRRLFVDYTESLMRHGSFGLFYSHEMDIHFVPKD